MKILQQGDCLIVEIEEKEIPKNSNKIYGGILLRGEATGHAHRLSDSSAEIYEDEESNLYVTTKSSPATLVHEEHKPLTLPTNSFFKVLQIREVDPFDENEIRTVID